MDFKLSKFIVPSVISMVLIGTYTNIDGFFIGNICGDDGLAAINIAWPIVALITSIGTGIGIGGSVILNKFRGKTDNYSAEQVKLTTVILLLCVGIFSSVFLKIVSEPLLVIMGANGNVLKYSVEYADVICVGAVFQIMGAGLIALLRNEQKTYFSMFCCIVGLIVHLLLDVLLAEKYKLAGVGMATVVSQAIIMIMCLFVLDVKLKLENLKKHIVPILIASTSPLGLNFVPSVVLLFTNYFALSIGGTAAVSAYAVMSYAVYTFDYIYQGVCDGIQPIISYCCGSGENQIKRRTIRISVIIMMLCTLLFVLLTPGLISIMPKLFSVSKDAEEMMRTGFIIYAFSYPFKAIVKYICSYYYACGETNTSNFLIYLDPIFFTPVLLIVLPKIIGVNGIWLAMMLAQFFIAVLGTVVFVRKKKKQVI